MSKTDPAALARDGIVPDEVRRLHLEPGDTLIVRVHDLTPNQMRSYQEALQETFPDHLVLVLHADEVLVAGPDGRDLVAGPGDGDA